MRLVQKNFLVREGEIDLIMQDRKEIVFVEVKTRKSDSFGKASEGITPQKLKKMQTAIERYFLQEQKNIYEEVFRIDAVCVSFLDGKNTPSIEHFVDIGEFVDL